MSRTFLTISFLWLLVLPPLGCGGPQEVAEGQHVEHPDPALGEQGEAAAEATSIELVASPPASPWIRSLGMSSQGLVLLTDDGALHELNPKALSFETYGQLEGSDYILLARSRLAFSAQDPAPRVFSTAGEELLRMGEYKGTEIFATSPCGRHLLLAVGPKVGFWDLGEQAASFQEGENVQDFINRQLAQRTMNFPGDVTALAAGQGGQLAVAINSPEHQGDLYTWSPEAADDLSFVGRTNGNVTHLALSPDGYWLAARNQDGSIWVTKSTQAGFSRWALDLKAQSITWNQNGQLILLQDQAIASYSTNSGEQLWSQATTQAPLACCSRGDAMACHDGTSAMLIHAPSGEVIAELFAWDEKWALITEAGHAGSAPASWFSGGAAAGGESTWLEDRDLEKVKQRLAAW